MKKFSRKKVLLAEKNSYIKNKFYQLLNSVDELNCYWTGTAARLFYNSIKIDMEILEGYVNAISKVSEDYEYAFDLYKRNNQRIYEIVKAIEVSGQG